MRFILQGISYYSQYRTCSQPTCSCRDDETKRHGPYWYSRQDGQVTYIGRNLPAHITRASAAHDRRLAEMSQLKAKLMDQVSVLHAHIQNQYISPGAREILDALGFTDTLTASDEELYGTEE